ncbi:MAG: hypothetical protein AAF545_11310 [Pseudomonadota bacterium]
MDRWRTFHVAMVFGTLASLFLVRICVFRALLIVLMLPVVARSEATPVIVAAAWHLAASHPDITDRYSDTLTF